jgi:hypothetical protein
MSCGVDSLRGGVMDAGAHGAEKGRNPGFQDYGPLIVQRRSLRRNYPDRFKGSFCLPTMKSGRSSHEFLSQPAPPPFFILSIADSIACQQKFACITARHARLRSGHLE